MGPQILPIVAVIPAWLLVLAVVVIIPQVHFQFLRSTLPNSAVTAIGVTLLILTPMLFPCDHVFYNYGMRGVSLIFFMMRFLEVATFPRSFTSKWTMREYYEFIGVSDNEPIRKFTSKNHQDKLSKTDPWMPKVAQARDRTLGYYLRQAARLLVMLVIMTFTTAYLEKYPFGENSKKMQLLNLLDLKSVLVNIMFGAQLFSSMDLMYTTGTLMIVDLLGAPYTPIFDKPYFSTSLRDFWSNRWNQPIKITIHRIFFAPTLALLRKLDPTKDARQTHLMIATLVSFAGSALLHEYACIMLIPHEWIPGEMSIFFMSHGIACVLWERLNLLSSLSISWKRFVGWIMTLFFLLLTSPFFNGPFARSEQFLEFPVPQSMKTSVPTEVVQIIFSYIHPSESLKFRRACKHIHNSLSDKYFASMNLSSFIQKTQQAVTCTMQPDALDRLWFSFPEIYQNVYARMKLMSVSSLSWWNIKNGSIPKAIGTLTELVTLDLFRSDLEGPIPVEIGKLVNLSSLTICLTKVTGSLPAEIGNLIQLERLSICSCSLTGKIPKTFGQLVNLKLLNLCSNGLSGSIPKEIGNLENLADLNLASNSLSGRLPSSIGKLVSIRHINLNDNMLDSEIPAQLGQLENLHNLQMQRNKFSGPIPKELGNLRNLYELNLASNDLQGPLPREICALSNLHFLSVSGNQLTGEIPAEIGRLNVVHLHLAHNKFQGGIPKEMLGGLRNVRFMSILPNRGVDIMGSLPDGAREGGNGSHGHVWNLLLGDVRRHSYFE
ncbi:hypothetical protein BDR26DRAFT_933694 [Obelidium mucronatum]|nr:hypothetical protein BDR26DRAFT_933694 [Obelidium mucronatum]